ncbi:hypothetical protein [Caballeronia humi]|uniref:Uncharacterized protein n=1 Tax=Caballeronia humi TaxID=326474 RepID=A0A158JAK8_9BURK|nr:hypothetical protein [Caballeronia humi]SAL65715.1 hypothetical protein AWB65_06228 [Caballeronia humi]
MRSDRLLLPDLDLGFGDHRRRVGAFDGLRRALQGTRCLRDDRTRGPRMRAGAAYDLQQLRIFGGAGDEVMTCSSPCGSNTKSPG